MSEKEGVLVIDVDPDSRAAEAGVRPGDVIKEINHKPTHSVADYQAAIQAAGKDGECSFSSVVNAPVSWS